MFSFLGFGGSDKGDAAKPSADTTNSGGKEKETKKPATKVEDKKESEPASSTPAPIPATPASPVATTSAAATTVPSSPPGSDVKRVEYNHAALQGRELPSGVNTPALIAEHEAVTKGKIRTRFPPEPNGYLHVGHAKSMNMNFELAFEKLGVEPENRQTIFRYDDTNPEAESTEYIQSLREDVDWLGWKPNPVTFTSDYFDVLYDLAVELIRRDKAYVCHQTKAEIEACREIAKAKSADPAAAGDPNSPWRNRYTSPPPPLTRVRLRTVLEVLRLICASFPFLLSHLAYFIICF
jgi:tRNA synthetases class I (E and Q), catalytic domain